MALPEDFSKIYGSTATGGLTPINDVNYAKGWEFVGSNPPTKNDFSYLQNLSDLKSQWLYSNKLQRTDPFGDIKADGAAAVSAALANLGLGEAAFNSLGVGQKWSNVTGKRQANVIYTNTTGKPIIVVPTAYAESTNPAITRLSIEVDGIEVGFNSGNAISGYGSGSSVPAIVPNGSTYRVFNLIGLLRWSELR